MNKHLIGAIGITSLLLLSACSSDNKEPVEDETKVEQTEQGNESVERSNSNEEETVRYAEDGGTYEDLLYNYNVIKKQLIFTEPEFRESMVITLGYDSSLVDEFIEKENINWVNDAIEFINQLIEDNHTGVEASMEDIEIILDISAFDEDEKDRIRKGVNIPNKYNN